MGLPSILFLCAVCGSAERGLPANGVDVAFDGRKRATLDVRVAAFGTTSGPEVGVTEARAEVGAQATLLPSTILGLDVPLLRRWVRSSGRTEGHDSLGDVEVRMTHTAARAIGSHLSFDGGLKLPTAPVQHDPDGRPLTPDLQPGCSAITPFVGATYRFGGRLLSSWTSVSLLMPFAVRAESPHPGDSLRASTSIQIDASRYLAARAGLHGRYDTTGELDGVTVTRSGGAAAHLSSELVLSPRTDLVVALGAAFPVLQEMRAYRATSPVLLASVGLDF